MRPLLYRLSYGDLVEGKRIELLSFPCKRNVLTVELTPQVFYRTLRETRTPNLFIRSETLYPLSYKGNTIFVGVVGIEPTSMD